MALVRAGRSGDARPGEAGRRHRHRHGPASSPGRRRSGRTGTSLRAPPRDRGGGPGSGPWSRASRSPTPSSSAAPTRAAATAVFANSLRAVGRAGIRTVCYNFMPVVDWTRTDLTVAAAEHRLRAALRHGRLRRLRRVHPAPRAMPRPTMRPTCWPGRGAGRRHGGGRAGRARAHDHRGPARRRRRGQRPRPLRAPARRLRRHDAGRPARQPRRLPARGRAGGRGGGRLLAVHPDDPPFPLFGLPRVVSTARRPARHCWPPSTAPPTA